MSWTVSVLAMKNLMLDLYELNKFEKAGFDRNEIKWNGQMATALHSCGSQLGPCPCGCRLHAFTEESLTKGGLHGLLVRLAGFAKCGHTLYPSCRHVHPDELALLNGMLPGYEWENPKMALCALGQLASPLQSVWLGAHIMQHVHKVFGSCDDITTRNPVVSIHGSFADPPRPGFWHSIQTLHENVSTDGARTCV